MWARGEFQEAPGAPEGEEEDDKEDEEENHPRCKPRGRNSRPLMVPGPSLYT